MEQKRTLLIWEGPERPFKKRDKKFYSKMIPLVVAIVLFLTFAGQFMIIIVFLSLLFAAYALYATPPKKSSYVLTTEGVEVEGESIPWKKMESYFISNNNEGTVINLDLNVGSLMKRRFLIPDSIETLEKATKIIEQYVKRKEPTNENKSSASKIINRIGLSLKEE